MSSRVVPLSTVDPLVKRPPSFVICVSQIWSREGRGSMSQNMKADRPDETGPRHIPPCPVQQRNSMDPLTLSLAAGAAAVAGIGAGLRARYRARHAEAEAEALRRALRDERHAA